MTQYISHFKVKVKQRCNEMRLSCCYCADNKHNSTFGSALPGFPPGDVPGISQRLPQIVLLSRGLFTQQADTLRRQQWRHNGLWQIIRAVRYHLVNKITIALLTKKKCSSFCGNLILVQCRAADLLKEVPLRGCSVDTTIWMK